MVSFFDAHGLHPRSEGSTVRSVAMLDQIARRGRPGKRLRGAALKAVQELLGHATIDMTMRYAHLSPDVRRDAVRLLDMAPSDRGTCGAHDAVAGERVRAVMGERP